MNVLFLTLSDFSNINEKGIYTDLLREFIKNNNKVYVISPIEKKRNKKTFLVEDKDCKLLKLCIGNIQKTNVIEKGITTITLESKYRKAIKKYFKNISFDLVLYSTPPITLRKAIKFVKKRDNAMSYLLLKDIFPQNAVDMGMLKKHGILGLLYKFFRIKEKKLYSISDYIGCMSQANVKYVLNNNEKINSKFVEICPNSFEITNINSNIQDKLNIRKKYNIPLDKTVLLYGGNLGKPQGIDFLIKCLYMNEGNKNSFFVIVGSGTEYSRIQKIFLQYRFNNAILIKHMPKVEYDLLVNACNIGLIFLDNRFTIPNFPSRLLSYMQASLPVLAATDKNTDLGDIILKNNFGYWCESNNANEFNKYVELLSNNEDLRLRMGKNANKYLRCNYTVEHSYNIIINHFNELGKRVLNV